MTKIFNLETYLDTELINIKTDSINKLGIDTDYETDSIEDQNIQSELKYFIRNAKPNDSYSWWVDSVNGEHSNLTYLGLDKKEVQQ